MRSITAGTAASMASSNLFSIAHCPDTIHTALLGIASGRDDSIRLADDLSLVRPNERLLAHRWGWVQGDGEMRQEAEATRYLVCEYPQWVRGEELGAGLERGTNRFYAAPMAIQVIKPVHALGFIYRGIQIERRHPMEPRAHIACSLRIHHLASPDAGR